jgi:carbamoyl-phosphate synthase large subunit
MTTILRSPVNSASAPGLLKFFKAHQFRLIGADITPEGIGGTFVDNFYRVPPADQIEAVVTKYCKIIEVEGVSWLISGPESEVLVLARYSEVFARMGAVVFHPPLDTLSIIVDKWEAFEFFSKAGVLMPQTFLVGQESSLRDKVVFKPRLGRGSDGVFVGLGKKVDFYRRLYGGSEYLEQAFIGGEEFTVDVLADMDGGVLNLVARRRVQTDSGISVVAETVYDQKLIDISLKICSLLKFCGGNCFQFIKDQNDEYYLTDINPRFGGGSILSLIASDTFRSNLVSLLQGRRDGCVENSFEVQPLRMRRFYDEVFTEI